MPPSRGRVRYCGTGHDYRCRTVSEKRCCYSWLRASGMLALVAAKTGWLGELTGTLSGPPLGPPVPGWLPRQLPPLAAMSGQFCRVEPIDSARHGAALYAAYATDREGRLWTYLPWGPYSGPEELGKGACARGPAPWKGPDFTIKCAAAISGARTLTSPIKSTPALVQFVEHAIDEDRFPLRCGSTRSRPFSRS
jgi:hypothetical protein